MPAIHELKELAVTETPLILFDCELPSGAVHRWSTHAVQEGGHAYQPRVLRHNLFELRWGAEDGVDTVAKISLTLANADAILSQVEHAEGWKAARLTARFLFYDLKNGAPASPAMVLFRGLLNPPEEITESVIRLSAHNRLNPQRLFLPEIRIQRRCPWAFPASAEERAEAVDGGARGRYSLFFRCGYSPDQSGGVGNLDGAAPFTTCDYTRGSCEARGMFHRDSSNRVTSRFGGVEFVPAGILVRGHGDAALQAANVIDNQARYNDFVPIHYGTVWTQPPVVIARNDGNLTRMEALLGAGEINGVVKVIVNGIEIPRGVAGQNMTATGWYNVVTPGTPWGGFNLEFTDAAGNPLGDPYGSMAFAAISVPNRISDGRALPQVKVLLEGLKLPTYAADGSPAGEVFSNNPAWALLDMLRRSGWTADEMDLASFAAAAAWCAETISVPDLHGNPTPRPRFQSNLTMRRRRSVADWIRGIRNAARLYLTYAASGQLQLRVEGALATQHPSLPEGSNATVELSGGWPAYEFDDASIARKESGESTVRLWSRSTADTPNRSTIEFQDEFNEYQQDSLSLVDADDAGRSRQEITVASTALGVPNFHQAARVLRLQIDRAVRGNTFIEFETSVKSVLLRPGDLVTVTYAREGLNRVPFRVTRIVPAVNHWSAQIEAQIHDDGWYSDDPGSATGGRVSRRAGPAELGIPRPLTGAVIDGDGIPQFSVAEELFELPDGTAGITLQVGFSVPARPAPLGADIPLLSFSPQIDTAGGTIAGGQTLYYGITAVNTDGNESDLSFVVRAQVPSSTNTNRVTLQGLSFSSNAATFHVYRGANPSQMYRVASDVTLAASFTDAGLPNALPGPPDGNYDHAQFDWRLELQPTVTATVFGANTIGSSTLELQPNEYSGMAVRIVAGKGAGQERIIDAHTADTLTVRPAWTIMPDATSQFVIAESSWKLGANGAESPVRFNVPARPGATLHLMGRAVNAVGRDSGIELAPVTRWQLGGGSGVEIDVDVPPLPAYGIQATGQGTVELVGVGFETLANTRGIFAGTLTLHYWNELTAPQTLALDAGVGAADTSITVTAAHGAIVGSLVQIGSELMLVEEIAGNTLTVQRGAYETAAAGHGAGALVFVLEQKVQVVPFARNFFGSPASGSYGYTVFLPDVRLAASDFFVTNARGNSETRKVAFTATGDEGLRTLSGGQFTIQVEGHLAIQTGAAPPLVVEQAHSVRDVFAVVQDAPTGAPVELTIRQGEDVYCTLTIAEDETISDIAGGLNRPPLAALGRLFVDITSVGATATTTPGRDLTVVIRL